LVAWFAARSVLGAICLLAAVLAAAERLRGGGRLGGSGIMATVAGPLRHLRTGHSGPSFATQKAESNSCPASSLFRPTAAPPRSLRTLRPTPRSAPPPHRAARHRRA